MGYKEMTVEELLDEYFEMRLGARNCYDPEISSILIDNYKEIETEIVNRTFKED